MELVDKDPMTLSDALSGVENEEWKRAMEMEMESTIKSDVWDLVELPENRKAIGSKWVFKRKIGSDGSVESGTRLVLLHRGSHNNPVSTTMKRFAQSSVLSFFVLLLLYRCRITCICTRWILQLHS